MYRRYKITVFRNHAKYTYYTTMFASIVDAVAYYEEGGGEVIEAKAIDIRLKDDNRKGR